ncbi:polysaccharide pyruvyl transferase family protein [Chloroflexota bacterium]
MHTFLIGGYYGAKNIGDEAILECMLKDIKSIDNDVKFIVASWNPEETKRQYGIDSFFWSDFSELFDAVKRSDLVILGGGGLFQDYWGIDPQTYLRRSHRDITVYGGLPILSNLYNKPSMIYAVGIGPLMDDLAREHTRIAIENSQVVTVRDTQSLSLLEEIGYVAHPESNSILQVVADPVFSLKTLPEDDNLIDSFLNQNKIDRKRKLVGVNIRYWDFSGPYMAWMRSLAEGLKIFLSDHTDFDILFIPFQINEHTKHTNDLEVIEKLSVLLNLPSRVYQIKELKDPHFIQAIIKHCEFLVGMRYHSLIMGLNTNTPIIGLPYDPKVTSLMIEAGLESYCCSKMNFESEELVSIMDKVLNEKESIISCMHEFHNKANKDSKKSAKLAVELANREILKSRTYIQNFTLEQVKIIQELDEEIEILKKNELSASIKLNEEFSKIHSLNELVVDLNRKSIVAENEFNDKTRDLWEKLTVYEEIVKKQSEEFERSQSEMLNKVNYLSNLKMDLEDQIKKQIKEFESEISNLQGKVTTLGTLNDKKEEIIIEYKNELGMLEEKVVDIESNQKKKLKNHKKTVAKYQDQISKINSKVQELERTVISQNESSQSLENQLNSIYTSNAWKVIKFYYTVSKKKPWSFFLKLFSRRNHIEGSIDPKSSPGFNQSQLESNIHNIMKTNPQTVKVVFGKIGDGLTKIFFQNRFSSYMKNVWKSIIKPIILFKDTYNLPDTRQVISYPLEDRIQANSAGTNDNELSAIKSNSVQVSLISSVKNEAGLIDKWFNRILNQTRLPDEIIIVDNGSTDGTFEELNKKSEISSIPIKIISNPDGNIAENRNIAVNEAQYSIIAVTDFGCFPKMDWLEKLIEPFEVDNGIQVSAGIYDPIYPESRNSSKRKLLWTWSKKEEINPNYYLPPGGSIAYKKEIWKDVGGYPEWLTLTGEDTIFDLDLIFHGGKWAFVPDAAVEWIAPRTLLNYFRKIFRWAIGDGESGARSYYFGKSASRLLVAAGLLSISFLPLVFSPQSIGIFFTIFLLTICLVFLYYYGRKASLSLLLISQRLLGEFVQLIGFFSGFINRRTVDIRRYANLKGLIIILSGIPIDDTGGGSRCTQIALEFLKQGFMVVFINKFPKDEIRDLNIKYAHPNLLVHSIEEFQWRKFKDKNLQYFLGKNNAVLVEFPVSDFVPLIKKIKKEDITVIYDLLDDWVTSLGSSWYEESIEGEIIDSSDILLATAANLQIALSEKTQRHVYLLPNAVNKNIFNPGFDYQKPIDMPTQERVITYVGALWGEWFDWDLLEKIAAANPASAICIIGDYRGQYQRNSPNIYFLGLKPQNELPAYLSHSDLAIIPWKVNKITQATSPLKVYEYLAMRLPVIAPSLDPLRDLPGVTLARDHDEFLHLVRTTNKSNEKNENVLSFIESNNWSSRIEVLTDLIESSRNTHP